MNELQVHVMTWMEERLHYIEEDGWKTAHHETRSDDFGYAQIVAPEHLANSHQGDFILRTVWIRIDRWPNTPSAAKTRYYQVIDRILDEYQRPENDGGW